VSVFTNPFSEIAAAGADQASATQIPSAGDIVCYSTNAVPEGAGLRLPNYTNNSSAIAISNDDVNDLLVYPIPGGTIDKMPADIPYSISAGLWISFWSFSPLDWLTIGGTSTPTPTPTPTYLAPAFTAFAISGQATPIEVGDSVASGNHTFTWATSNSSNVQTNSISIADTTHSTTLATGLANDGSEVVSLPSAVTNTSPATNVWTIDGINTHSTHFSRTTSVVWQYRVHAGDSANATLTGAQILALALNPLKASPPGDYVITGTNYKYLAYPDSMGDISAIVDPSTGFPIALAQASPYTNTTASGLTYALVSVTNSFGVVVNYRVFRTLFTIGGSLTFRVS
jgi:hypothetical protein